MINFDGDFIDVDSVVLIIKKLQLYIEKEEEIINRIINELSILENYYISDNGKIFNNKKSKLYYSMHTLLNNKKAMIEFLYFTVNSYLDKDENAVLRFNNDIS